MQTTDALLTLNTTASLLFSLLPIPLSHVPFHQNTEAITRYFAKRVSYAHCSARSFNCYTCEQYTFPHVVHDECDEINIVLSSEKLLHTIQLHDQEYRIANHSSGFPEDWFTQPTCCKARTILLPFALIN